MGEIEGNCQPAKLYCSEIYSTPPHFAGKKISPTKVTIIAPLPPPQPPLVSTDTIPVMMCGRVQVNGQGKLLTPRFAKKSYIPSPFRARQTLPTPLDSPPYVNNEHFLSNMFKYLFQYPLSLFALHWPQRCGPYIGGNLPKVRSRHCPHGILPRPYTVDI